MQVITKTDIGLQRTENQDTVIARDIEDCVIVVLCDGMGGVNAGGEASDIAANEIFNRLSTGYRKDFDENSIKNLIISSINAANIIVFDKSLREDGKDGMGTTCVCGIVKPNMAFIANVGDSRAYIIDESKISQITNDHTVVRMLLDQGKINEEEAENHPHKNIITRAVGIEEKIQIDYYEKELKPQDRVLFCSDGLSSYCKDEIIFSIISKNKESDAVAFLIEKAKELGGNDNITVAITSNTSVQE